MEPIDLEWLGVGWVRIDRRAGPGRGGLGGRRACFTRRLAGKACPTSCSCMGRRGGAGRLNFEGGRDACTARSPTWACRLPPPTPTSQRRLYAAEQAAIAGGAWRSWAWGAGVGSAQAGSAACRACEHPARGSACKGMPLGLQPVPTQAGASGRCMPLGGGGTALHSAPAQGLHQPCIIPERAGQRHRACVHICRPGASSGAHRMPSPTLLQGWACGRCGGRPCANGAAVWHAALGCASGMPLAHPRQQRRAAWAAPPLQPAARSRRRHGRGLMARPGLRAPPAPLLPRR